MNQELGPLLVELYIDGAHVLGVCRQVQERRRLIDVLNHPDEVLDVEEAHVTLGPDAAPRRLGSFQVQKRSILAAVPRETQEQNRRRAMLTNMMGRHQTDQKQIALVVPTLAIDGAAHIAAGAGTTRNFAGFSRFFPVTNATLTAAGTAPRQLDVVLVGRDRIVGISIAGAPRLSQPV